MHIPSRHGSGGAATIPIPSRHGSGGAAACIYPLGTAMGEQQHMHAPPRQDGGQGGAAMRTTALLFCARRIGVTHSVTHRCDAV